MYPFLIILVGFLIWTVNFKGIFVTQNNEHMISGGAPKERVNIPNEENSEPTKSTGLIRERKTTMASVDDAPLVHLGKQPAKEYSKVQGGANFKKKNPSDFIK